MLPIRDENPHFLTPVVTLGIIAINVLVWVLVQRFGTEPGLAYSICRNGLVPAELLGTAPPGAGYRISANAVCLIGADGNWASLLTHMYLHGGWLHIIGNMWFLWIFG
ncbi:MAG: rhomboid family intramembrane serine protease, partial [Gammaproteobacteria bacterium]|nr:rhomboid family intramembrane serine protease [Gammaproteobacteria bacterium]